MRLPVFLDAAVEKPRRMQEAVTRGVGHGHIGLRPDPFGLNRHLHRLITGRIAVLLIDENLDGIIGQVGDFTQNIRFERIDDNRQFEGRQVHIPWRPPVRIAVIFAFLIPRTVGRGIIA